MFYYTGKRHIGGRTHQSPRSRYSHLQMVEDGVAMHDLGSAFVPTARLPAVTPDLLARTDCPNR